MSENNKKINDELADMTIHGKLKLAKPIQDGSVTYDELTYNFESLTGTEYNECMDSDPAGRNAFNLTRKQAMSLFAAAAAKNTPGIDERDIKERMGIADTIKATQLAVAFFTLTSRLGDQRISN